MGRATRYPTEFRTALMLHERIEAGCLAHARRKFNELVKAGNSTLISQALQRIAALYRIEQEVATASSADRFDARQRPSMKLWGELHAWLQQEVAQVPDGGGIASAINYSLRRWVRWAGYCTTGT